MKALIVVIALLALQATAAETYKWIDEDGNVHYSDTPVEGAKVLDLPKPMTFDAPEIPDRPRSPANAGESEEPAFEYTAFDFVSPKQDQVFWATGGEIAVQLDASPALFPGHEVRLYADGALGEPMQGLGTTLTGVHRGAHTVRAEIVDESGKTVASTETITFHVKQRSIANPQNRPARPRKP